MVRVLIVEDQKIMQKYFEYILMQDPEFRHVQTISDARELGARTFCFMILSMEQRQVRSY